MIESTPIAKIKELITEYVRVNAWGKSIDNDTPIFELGYVNSLFAIELMCFIEKNFQVKIKTTDLDINNFRTIDTICDFVRNKTYKVKPCEYQIDEND